MKEKVGVVYDSSARGVDIVSILVSRLPLSQESMYDRYRTFLSGGCGRMKC